jgi:hypothetical protein
MRTGHGGCFKRELVLPDETGSTIGIKFVRSLLETGSVAHFSTYSTGAEMTIYREFAEAVAVLYVVFGRTVPV